MAEFCEACATELDLPYGDFRNIAAEDEAVQVLCEGCGITYVDSNGCCIDYCLKGGQPGHGDRPSEGPEHEDGPWGEG